MTEHTFPEVEVTEKAVYFDGYELPWYISQDGVDFKPGGRDDFNRLRIEFLVSHTTFSDGLKWELEHLKEWTWLKRAIALEMRVQTRAFDRIMKEYA
ncbi:hypothetical protein PBI_IRONMAN_40 [Mycobacterium phage IronMan]|uniref:Uncharacterized protein n=1 Tax=Mycobacterium phage IronMan TaxID=2499042 RepID=A0A3S9UD83_9CAUD|nr:hypothetical protein KI247_gp61 [Mycobacterium phage IronMan]AZS08242.1 hypothetical protein PBI_IRONMAN_40 [Mycobacterium phage IronMan]